MQRKYKVSLLYEASSRSQHSIIRNLEEYYDNELLYSLRGILNGTTKFYSDKKWHNEGLPYSEALKEAQEKGFCGIRPDS